MRRIRGRTHRRDGYRAAGWGVRSGTRGRCTHDLGSSPSPVLPKRTAERYSRRKCQMRRIVLAAAVSLCVVSLAATASADTLVLRDGTRVPGTIVSIAARMIMFEDSSGISHRYSANEVASLEFTSTERRNTAAGIDDRA